jgi:hypothetical protein
MNIGSVDPNFTGSRALAGPGNAQPTIDQETFGTSGNFITKQQTQTKSSRTTLELLPIKTLML